MRIQTHIIIYMKTASKKKMQHFAVFYSFVLNSRIISISSSVTIFFALVNNYNIFLNLDPNLEQIPDRMFFTL